MATIVQNQRINAARVAKISVERLFGHYTYDLEPTNPEAADPRLLILYGDNGSGKTTIAQLLFHILSPATEHGHRSFLARTRFKRFRVTFAGGATIEAARENHGIEGPYSLRFSARDESLEVEVGTNDKGLVGDGDVDDEEIERGFELLFSSPLCSYFLSDNRVLRSDTLPGEDEQELAISPRMMFRIGRGDAVEKILEEVVPTTRTLNIEPSIQRVETWIRLQALAASTEGEATTSQIYTEIARRFVEPVAAKEATPEMGLQELQKTLRSLAERSKESALGLTSAAPLEHLIENLALIPLGDQSLFAANVLRPYVESIKVRLDAVASIERSLSTFVRLINDFYTRKTVRISVKNGVQVFGEDGEVLQPSLLSSGEKQLMLLLCNILVGTDQPSLFIIDEPELSLNVKWQRILLDSLLELAQESQVQFILATHSVELLTQHKSCVARLDDTDTKRATDDNGREADNR